MPNELFVFLDPDGKGDKPSEFDQFLTGYFNTIYSGPMLPLLPREGEYVTIEESEGFSKTYYVFGSTHDVYLNGYIRIDLYVNPYEPEEE